MIPLVDLDALPATAAAPTAAAAPPPSGTKHERKRKASATPPKESRQAPKRVAAKCKPSSEATATQWPPLPGGKAVAAPARGVLGRLGAACSDRGKAGGDSLPEPESKGKYKGKPGDPFWVCRSCGTRSWEARSSCRKCGVAKPLGAKITHPPKRRGG
mmetsp:Transcript_28775/g.92193  ORF Transcript_28775/g.92193 Transcript_28775/m.92193 type:complete len:158 (-) Transcript_28775:51-524(-)